MNIPNWKAWAIGVVGTAFSLFVLTRLLPGGGARLGLFPSPLFGEKQKDWIEPFGYRPLNSLWTQTAQAKPKTSSTGDQWGNVY